jgi:undecaprenyl-diphosphatase
MLVIAATLPTALIGFACKDYFETMFASTNAVGVALLITGCLLMSTRLAPAPKRGLGQTGPGRAVLIGLAQGLAITPGISRSGTTISIALLLGVQRDLAARFSFLLSIPAILGALVLQLPKLNSGAHAAPAPLLAGALCAAVTGYLALKVLLGLVREGRLHWFAYYCWALGLAALLWWR